MIEDFNAARATALPRPPTTAWTRPQLPRGPSPISKFAKRIRARLLRSAARPKECGC